MGLFDRLFKKNPDEFFDKGNRLLSSENYFEARECFKDGLRFCKAEQFELISQFEDKISVSNHGLATLNLLEAEYCIARGDKNKAVDNIELAKSLSHDEGLREKTEQLLLSISKNESEITDQPSSHSCNSCSKHESSQQVDFTDYSAKVDPSEYFDLLIRQLPPSEYERYSALGEDFACSYVAASEDDHSRALSLLEMWDYGTNADIYYCEKGKLLHRLGRDVESENCLQQALRLNVNNTLSWLAIVQLMVDKGRLQESLTYLNQMIECGHMVGQARLMRGEIFEALGNIEPAITDYAALLPTSMSKSAAEKLYGLLHGCGRETEAAQVFKTYLGKCCH